MNDLPENYADIAQLLRSLELHIEALERRVDTVESRLAAAELPGVPPTPRPLPAPAPPSPPPAPASASLPQAGRLFQVLGKALFGIAGAYVLRAIEESSTLPRLLVAVAGIAYAFVWLLVAARARRSPSYIGAIYAGTAALILAPMLWELTLRFNVLPLPAAAVVVCGFALASLASAGFSPRRVSDLAPVLRVTSFAAAVLALALAIASHVLVPFVAALLLLSAVSEFAPACDRFPDLRAVFALAADLAIWILIYVYYAGPSGREGFPELRRLALFTSGLALFVLSAVSVAIRTLLRARPIELFGSLQTVIAFLLFAVALADFGPSSAAPLLGVISFALSAACYAALFLVFAHAPARRNLLVFAAWAAMLLFAGSFLCLSPRFSILLLVAAALAAMALGRRPLWAFFAYYGMAFLLAAALAAGALGFIAVAFAGVPAPPRASLALVAAAALLCYALAPYTDQRSWPRQTLLLALAALALALLAALLIAGLVFLVALCCSLGPHHLALIRTVVLCAAALAMVFGGARRQRRELTRIGYSLLTLTAVKLLAEDLRHGHLAYIAASIFLFAFALIAAPRLARPRQKV